MSYNTRARALIQQKVNKTVETIMAENNIPAFLGENTQDAEDHFDRYAKGKAWDGPKKLGQMNFMLQADAGKWLDGLPDGNKDTFDNFKAAFEKEYYPTETERWERVSKYEALRQKGHGLDKYLSSVRYLGRKLGKSEKEVMDKLISGLRPQVKGHVIAKNPKNMQDTITEA